MDIIEVFTDGAAKNNNNKNKIRIGGMGVFFGDNHKLNISAKLDGKVTNQIAELTACILAIKLLVKVYPRKKIKIKIYSDSMYTINCVTKWALTWEKNDWKKKNKKSIENEELIKTLYKLTNKYKVSYVHVNSHLKEPTDKTSIEYFKWYGNDQADKLANLACIN
jgi:ribonuclease HI